MNFCYYNSPIGTLYIEVENNKLSRLDLLKEEKPNTTAGSKLLQETIRQLEEYFSKKRREFDLPLSLNGTDYQKKVWEELLKIPFGKTKSYGEIASLIQNPRGSRSVGMACSKNPIMIVVPCHRVIGKNRRLTGFACGTDIKETLLRLENNTDWRKSI